MKRKICIRKFYLYGSNFKISIKKENKDDGKLLFMYKFVGQRKKYPFFPEYTKKIPGQIKKKKITNNCCCSEDRG